MKKISLLCLLICIVFSCNIDDESNELEVIQTTETIIKGHVSDVERNINIEDFRIVLGKTDYCGSGFVGGPCVEIIDTVYTDANGNYALTFDYISGGQYLFIKQYYGSLYYTEHINPTEIIEGAENIKDIDAWYPTILKLSLNVTNNDFPHLRVKNKITGRDNYHFGTSDIYEANTDTIVYQRTRPNSDVELMFYYSTGYSNGSTHRYFENITTTLQDTISLSYNIDCSSF